MSNEAPNLNSPRSSEDTCAICQSPLSSDQPAHGCNGCRTRYHEDCWTFNGGCAIYGCAQVPATEKRNELEVPAAFWGQEEKPCPQCQQQILAAAVRCRHCGAVFDTARPLDHDAFQSNARIRQRTSTVARTSIWLFVLAIIPCTAPIMAVVTPIWYANNRDVIDALPGHRSAICKLAMAVSIGQTVLAIVLSIVFTVTRASV